ncbi:hypothetical protein [Nocardia sp. NBC_00403]|uniref:hypothetical protein n=1 Tax=Nocardia sp. NBC_00403 TaxID=2975990 RepID=UPI002E1A426E
MSATADHTILAHIASLPVYGEVLLDDFRKQRRILVVPTESMALASRVAGDDSPSLSMLLQRPATVKWSELDPTTALRLGQHVPLLDRLAEWSMVAPVVWASQRHDIPVLTRQPELYEGHHVMVVQAP